MNEEKKLYIYSYGTDPNKISVDETSKHWNLDVKIDSKKYFSDWKNKYKIKIFLKYLKTLEGNPICLFADAYDVIFNSNKTDIIESFLKYEKDIIISGGGLWPKSGCGMNFEKCKWPKRKLPLRYLCAGLIIGYRNSLITMMKTIGP